jgi:hypothetical protein
MRGKITCTTGLYRVGAHPRGCAPVCEMLLTLQCLRYRDEIGCAGRRDGILRQRLNLSDDVRKLIRLNAGGECLLDSGGRIAGVTIFIAAARIRAGRAP